MQFSWYVPKDLAHKSLGKFLHHEGLSKTLLSKAKFHGGAIYVNHHQRNSDYPISAGDQITITLAPERDAAYIEPVFEPLPILFEDAHFLIVNKPAGLPSIPSRHFAHDSVANRVKGHLIQIGHESRSVHVITRLDQDTSGLMLFAKHSFAHALMAKQLHSQSLEKTYLAIAAGTFDQKAALIDAPIARVDAYQMKRTVQANGKPSQTKYRVLQQCTQGALLQVLLLTGRTHQIRVHMAHIGHPLFGDPLYGPNLASGGLKRQALHCAHLRFVHPFTQEVVDCKAPMPADMAHLLAMLNAGVPL